MKYTKIQEIHENTRKWGEGAQRAPETGGSAWMACIKMRGVRMLGAAKVRGRKKWEYCTSGVKKSGAQEMHENTRNT